MRLYEERRAATLEDVSHLRRALGRELHNLRVPFDIANDVLLAVAEMLTNTVAHGQPSPTMIGLSVDLVGAALRIEMVDDGGAFDDFNALWKAAALKDVVASGTSGLGLALTNAALRNVTYEAGPPNRLAGWRALRRRRPAVLILEDDPTLLRLYGMILKSRYRVFSATSIDQALQIAAASTVDLVLSDYHVGEELGTGLLQELARDAGRLPVPVVMMSSDRNVAARTTADGFGVELFLQKPVAPKQLEAAVEQALTRSSRRLASLFRYFGASVEQLLAAPDRDELQRLGVCWRQASATAGGGDFVLHLAAPGRDRLVLADVMGHGLHAKAGAIAYAATMRALFAASDADAGPAAYLDRLSDVLRRDAALSETIVTVVVCDRLADGAVEIACAGHPSPVLITPDGATPIDVCGPLLGLFDKPGYRCERVEAGSGRRLVLVSDGIEPQQLAGGGALPDGLVTRLRDAAAGPVEAALDAAESWAQATHGPSPQDDWTIMLLELGPQPAA